jgi:nucleoid DNA-binding protein
MGEQLGINELVEKVSEKMGIPKKYVSRIIQATLNQIVDTVSNNGRVLIRGFGVFELRYKNPRKRTHFQKRAWISGHNFFRFKASRRVQRKVNEGIEKNPERTEHLPDDGKVKEDA